MNSARQLILWLALTVAWFLPASALGHAASMDLYQAFNGDPVNYFDPRGLIASNFINGANDNQVKTKFTISDALVLKNGHIAITGVSEKHLPLTKRGKAATASGEIEIEIVSIGIVNPPSADPCRQDLQVHLRKGRPLALKGATVYFED
jgi:hypothetical protein